MPLPKPSKSKTISRRIKKPKPLLFTAASQPEKLPPSKPNKPPRERRVRVICTDPDATDSSSDEEGERAPIRPRYTHKRFVCEIPLPASPPTSFNEIQQEETSMGSASSSSACNDSERRKGFKIARKEVGVQSLYERTNEPVSSPSADKQSECLSADNLSAGMPADNPSAGLSADNLSGCPPADNLSVSLPADKSSGCLSMDNPSGCLSMDNPSAALPAGDPIAGLLADNLSGCAAAEEFEQFLSEFFSVQDESSIPTWDTEMDLLNDSMFDDPLDFELDFESATWINSVQTV